MYLGKGQKLDLANVQLQSKQQVVARIIQRDESVTRFQHEASEMTFLFRPYVATYRVYLYVTYRTTGLTPLFIIGATI